LLLLAIRQLYKGDRGRPSLKIPASLLSVTFIMVKKEVPRVPAYQLEVLHIL